MSNEIMDLSFVAVTAGKITSLWAPQKTTTYAGDNALGRGYADECFNCMQAKNQPTLLGAVTKAMIEGGVYAGVEIGFIGRIAAIMMRNSIDVSVNAIDLLNAAAVRAMELPYEEFVKAAF